MTELNYREIVYVAPRQSSLATLQRILNHQKREHKLRVANPNWNNMAKGVRFELEE